MLVALFVALNLLLIGLSIPLIKGRVKPNHWYGFRIRLTLEDPEIWYPANRYTGWLLLGYGGLLLAVSLALPLLPHGLPQEQADNLYGLVVAGVMLAGLVPVVILSFRYAHKLAEEQESDDGPQIP